MKNKKEERAIIRSNIRTVAKQKKEFELWLDLMERHAHHFSWEWIAQLKYLVKKGELSVEKKPWKSRCPIMSSNIYEPNHAIK